MTRQGVTAHKRTMRRTFEQLPNRRAIVDRRALADALAALDEGTHAQLRRGATAILKAALDAGRAEIARRLSEHPSRGLEAANAQAYLVDQIIVTLADFTTARLYPLSNPTASERLLLIAVGGYGRGEMAPFSDVDLGFVTPWKQTPWAEQAIESMLYALWDLGLKVGHSSRSLDDMVRQAKADVTVRTALLEARYLWGDEALYEEAAERFDQEVRSGTERQFVADKLAERNARHVRLADEAIHIGPATARESYLRGDALLDEDLVDRADGVERARKAEKRGELIDGLADRDRRHADADCRRDGVGSAACAVGVRGHL